MRIPIDPKNPSIGQMDETIKSNEEALKDAKEKVRKIMKTKRNN